MFSCLKHKTLPEINLMRKGLALGLSEFNYMYVIRVSEKPTLREILGKDKNYYSDHRILPSNLIHCNYSRNDGKQRIMNLESTSGYDCCLGKTILL